MTVDARGYGCIVRGRLLVACPRLDACRRRGLSSCLLGVVDLTVVSLRRDSAALRLSAVLLSLARPVEAGKRGVAHARVGDEVRCEGIVVQGSSSTRDGQSEGGRLVRSSANNA